LSKDMDNLRQAYESIPVPGELDAVLAGAVQRGRREVRREMVKRNMVRSAAGFIVLFTALTITVNTVPAFAEALGELPLVGNLVRVLRLDKGTGSGGEITDGTQVGVGGIEQQGETEVLKLSFSEAGLPAETANYYEAEYREYPASLLFSIPGARGLALEEVFPDLAGSKLVKDVYRLVTLDDSCERFVITFKQPVETEIREYTDPARLELIIKAKTADNAAGPVYSLRSGSQRFGESIGVIEGVLRYEAGGRDVRMLKDAAGTYCVEEGYYATEAEAEARRQELRAAGIIDFELYIESRGPTDSPKVISE